MLILKIPPQNQIPNYATGVVIKKIHYTTDPMEILKALEEIGFTVRQVVNIKHQQTKMPLPIFFVDLEAITKEIFNIISLLNTKI